MQVSFNHAWLHGVPIWMISWMLKSRGNSGTTFWIWILPCTTAGYDTGIALLGGQKRPALCGLLTSLLRLFLCVTYWTGSKAQKIDPKGPDKGGDC